MDCPICDAIPGFLVCTLHGGHMTATEVELRHRYDVEGDKWVLRKPSPMPGDAFTKDLVDKTFDILRSRGLIVDHDEQGPIAVSVKSQRVY